MREVAKFGREPLARLKECLFRIAPDRSPGAMTMGFGGGAGLQLSLALPRIKPPAKTQFPVNLTRADGARASHGLSPKKAKLEIAFLGVYSGKKKVGYKVSQRRSEQAINDDFSLLSLLLFQFSYQSYTASFVIPQPKMSRGVAVPKKMWGCDDGNPSVIGSDLPMTIPLPPKWSA
ncbi:hypothetical protein VTK26DRAFT_1690 [Humicola hyalothermophila]